MTKKILPGFDRTFVSLIIAISGMGILIFVSASLSELSKNPEIFQRMLFTQISFGVIGLFFSLFIFSRVSYVFWRRNALPILIFAVGLMFLVYVPGLGLAHGGARRWISLGFISFQPAEFLKYATIVYWSSWLAFVGKKIENWRYGLMPFLIITGIVGIILIAQPDTDGLIVLAGSMFCLYLLAGAPWKHIGVLFVLALVCAGGLIATKPYILDRVKTFGNPNLDPSGSSYQIRQSLIAVGAGGFWGRGYGQSVQKFDYLPEPVGDSIFAVFAEEFGFFGSFIFICLYVWLLFRGMRIATRAPDNFSRFLVSGFILIIIIQSFMNIGSVIGVIPFTGLPLLLVSHGGTALFITLLAVGVIIHISRFQTISVPSINNVDDKKSKRKKI